MIIHDELLDIPAEQYEEIYRQIFYDVTKDLKPVENPVALVIGGQPGSGKTTMFLKMKKETYNNNIAQLDNDFFRKYHPNYHKLYEKYKKEVGTYTNEFVSKLIDRLAEDLAANNYNFSVESSFRNAETVTWLHDLLKNTPYSLNVILVSTPKEIAWESVKKRYNDMKEIAAKAAINGETIEPPRAVPWEFFDNSCKCIPGTIREIWENKDDLNVGNILAVTRSSLRIYDSAVTPNIDPSYIISNWLERKKIETCHDYEISK